LPSSIDTQYVFSGLYTQQKNSLDETQLEDTQSIGHYDFVTSRGRRAGKIFWGPENI